MTRKNVTRADLAEAVYEKIGVSRIEAADLVEQVIEEICSTLAAGERVKLSGFGVLSVREKGTRVGRNPKIGEEVPIEARQVITFSASDLLRDHVNGSRSKPLSG